MLLRQNIGIDHFEKKFYFISLSLFSNLCFVRCSNCFKWDIKIKLTAILEEKIIIDYYLTLIKNLNGKPRKNHDFGHSYYNV